MHVRIALDDLLNLKNIHIPKRNAVSCKFSLNCKINSITTFTLVI